MMQGNTCTIDLLLSSNYCYSINSILFDIQHWLWVGVHVFGIEFMLSTRPKYSIGVSV